MPEQAGHAGSIHSHNKRASLSRGRCAHSSSRSLLIVRLPFDCSVPELPEGPSEPRAVSKRVTQARESVYGIDCIRPAEYSQCNPASGHTPVNLRHEHLHITIRRRPRLPCNCSTRKSRIAFPFSLTLKTNTAAVARPIPPSRLDTMQTARTYETQIMAPSVAQRNCEP